MTIKEFKKLALTFPDTVDAPHFDKIAFKVIGKRIFTTLHETSKSINVKLLPNEQMEICKLDTEGIYPVDNKWGLQGWTTIELDKVSDELIFYSLETAYKDVFKSKSKRYE